MTYAEQFIANTIGEADGQDFDWEDFLPDTVDRTEEDQLERIEFPDGSAIVVTCTGWDFGIHHSWVEAPEVIEAVEASDNWTCCPQYVWPECVFGLDSKHTQPPTDKFAALDGAMFDLDSIDTEFVMIDDGWLQEGFWCVDAEDFKRFMLDTRDWNGDINPYESTGETTKFGDKLFRIEGVADAAEGEELPAVIEAWTFWFDEDEGYWQLDILPTC